MARAWVFDPGRERDCRWRRRRRLLEQMEVQLTDPMADTDGGRDAASRGAAEDIKQIARAPALVAADVDDEVVIMSIGKGHYFGLDDIASEIWRRLDGTCSLCGLLDGLARDYDAPREVIEKDVVALLRRMEEQGLVVLS